MKRWTRLVGLLGFAVVVTAGALGLWPGSGRITKENFNRIHAGMTLAEVEAILGPPGDYASGPVVPDDDSSEWTLNHCIGGNEAFGFATTVAVWTSDAMLVSVGFGPDGTMTVLEPLVLKRVPQSPLDNLVWRVERQWRKWFPE
jgi:hypothetical protein